MRNRPNDPVPVVGKFVYDPSSPSFLRWKYTSYKGWHNSQVNVAAGDVAGSLHGTGYWRVSVGTRAAKKSYAINRIVWAMHNGAIPEGFEIDHEDGDKTNNAIGNLRCVPIVVNARNTGMAKNNTSGVTGVTYYECGKGYYYWCATWRENGKGKRQQFSVLKLGEEVARERAIAFRAAKMIELNEAGAGYTERHGQ